VDPHQGILRRLLGCLRAPQHRERDAVDEVLMRLHQKAERIDVARQAPADEIAL
jgi:hypothetical protein